MCSSDLMATGFRALSRSAEIALEETQEKPLTEEQKKEISSKKQIARDVRIQEEGRVIRALVDKYKDFAAQRLAIETKYNKDISELEKQRIDALLSGNYASAATISQAITQATKNKAKELTAFDFDLLKKNPDYIRAFKDWAIRSYKKNN